MSLNGLTRSGQGVNGGGSGVNGGVGGDHGTSGPSTPSTLSPGDTFNLEDEFNKVSSGYEWCEAVLNDIYLKTVIYILINHL